MVVSLVWISEVVVLSIIPDHASVGVSLLPGGSKLDKGTAHDFC